MTECALLRINKAAMVRVLHQEHALSEVFVAFLARSWFQADLVDQLFTQQRLARILLLLAQFGRKAN